ncbi:MAG: bifunctional adenosylcobinamide kinase/adenosylcobinamide-phosphate guanylyltransferase [Deltaproteobacteria bacterium]|nr:bifunctional adenosylcobinamide kinase/adenosylcobinamide-phosphate guanylyltransferase [Deltaproteobacteria bacterium]
MKKNIFVIGGCRSGKSRHALELAEQMPGAQKAFVATCVVRDEEMNQRVARHRKERSSSWITLEVPVRLADTIRQKSGEYDLMLIDCLTLWMSNLLLETEDFETIDRHVMDLTRALQSARCPVILVSNEVGTGIVPENRLARLFRDATGFSNQKVAACADEVIWMVAGIPVKVK